MSAVSNTTEAKTGGTPPSGLSEFWFYFSRNKGAVIGLFIFLVILIVAVFAPFVAPHNPSVQNRELLLLPPLFQEGGTWGHILGTDPVGRDILSRLIYGARFSLFIGVVVVSSPAISAARSIPSSCASWTLSWRSPRCCWPSCWWRFWGRAS